MQKDPEFLKSDPRIWAALPPRFSSAQELFELIDGKPVKVDGFCICCDSNVVQEWCTAKSAGSRSVEEIRHLSELDVGVLRPSELALIKACL